MSHINTAFKIGALTAQQVFETELQKQGAGIDLSGATGPVAPGGAKTMPGPSVGQAMQGAQLTPPPGTASLPGRTPSVPPMGPTPKTGG